MTERSEVLHMLDAGKISAAEGIHLLTAMRSSRPADIAGRWLHLRVTNLKSNTPQVNINLPMSWVNAGLQIGRNFVPELDEVDWNQIIEAAKSGSTGRLLEVEELDNDQRVEIFVD